MRIDSFDGLPYWSSVTLSADRSTKAMPIDNVWGYSVQIVWTGASAAGTLKLQASNDITDDSASVVNWEDIAGSSYTVSGPGSAFYNYDGAFYKWFRVVFTFSSGTGTITVTNVLTIAV